MIMQATVNGCPLLPPPPVMLVRVFPILGTLIFPITTLLINTSLFIKPLQTAVNLLTNTCTTYNDSCWICLQAPGQSGEAWPASLQLWAQTQGLVLSNFFWTPRLICIHYQRGSHSPYYRVKLRIQVPLCLHSSRFDHGYPVGSLSNTSCNLLFKYLLTMEYSTIPHNPFTPHLCQIYQFLWGITILEDSAWEGPCITPTWL